MTTDLLPITLLVISILIIFLLFKKKVNQKTEAVNNNEEEDLVDMNKSFLEKAQGKEVVNAIIVYSINDLNIIRSLLFSSGIENYVRNDHMSSLLPGIGINGLTSMIISIIKSDYSETKEIVMDYIEEKINERNNQNVNKEIIDKIRNVGEFVVTGRFVSSSSEARDPEIIKINEIDSNN